MFDILDIQLDDEKTFALLCEGNTSGVFQLESSGMQQLLKQIQPKDFEDIIAVLALYRPAPLTIKGEDGLTMVERYVKVQHGEIEPEYLHPDLEEILGVTNGQLIYQEQMMQIAGKFSGFTLGERDKLRKAMGKKDPVVMASLKDKFVTGAVKNGYNTELAEELWNWIEKGAGYLFNKSHSTSYALISYQTAWLKAHGSPKFFASTLSAELQDEEEEFDANGKKKSKSKKLEKIAFYVEEAKEHGLEIVPPLIGASSHEFKVDNERIVFALNAIRGVGAGAIKQIIQNRPYANFDDFIASNVFKGSEVKKGCIVGLIKAGAFDDTDPDRIEIMEKYGATRPKKERTEKPLVTNEDWLDPEATMLRWEREVLGLYLSGHPLGKYSFVPYESIPVGGKATVGGEINRIKKIKTKRKQDMAFATLSTPEGNREITIFPRQYAKYADLLEEGKMLIIDGKKEEENILAERIRKA